MHLRSDRGWSAVSAVAVLFGFSPSQPSPVGCSAVWSAAPPSAKGSAWPVPVGHHRVMPPTPSRLRFVRDDRALQTELFRSSRSAAPTAAGAAR